MKEIRNTELFKQDLDYILENILESHPNLEYYLGADYKLNLENMRVELIDEFNESGDINVLWRLFKEIGDLHTTILSLPIVKYDFSSKLLFEIREGRVFVSSDFQLFTAGEEVLEINNIRVDELLFELGKRIVGNNRQKMYLLAKYLISSSLSSEQSKVTIKTNVREADLAQTSIQSDELLNSYYIQDGIMVFNYIVCEDNAFYPYPNAREFFYNMFDEIRQNNVNNMRIDIRGNQGGDSSIFDLIYPYITSQPLKTFSITIEGKEVSVGIKNPNKYGEVGNELFYTGGIELIADDRIASSAEWLYLELVKNNLLSSFTRIDVEEKRAGDMEIFTCPKSGLVFSISSKWLVFKD